jgi:hypothetical protein
VLTTYFAPLVEQCVKVAVAAGVASPKQADAWSAEQRRRGEEDRFFAAIPFFLVSARRA